MFTPQVKTVLLGLQHLQILDAEVLIYLAKKLYIVTRFYTSFFIYKIALSGSNFSYMKSISLVK
jgi:hypothetical protein